MLELRSSLARLLSSLISQISPTDPQLANTLDFWQKQYFLIEDAPAGPLDLLNAVDLGALSFQGSVLDNPTINTRAGLYVYLNALVSSYRVLLSASLGQVIHDMRLLIS